MEAELIYFTTKLRDKLLEPNSASFTGMSFVIPKTPALETFIYLRQVLTQKKKIKAIASFTQCM